MDQLYRRVMRGKRTTYEPVIPEPPQETVLEFNDAQCLTVAGALGTTLLMIFERNMTKMKNGSPALAERKIKAVKAAILDLYKGTGEKIQDEVAEYIFEVWNRTMKELSQG